MNPVPSEIEILVASAHKHWMHARLLIREYANAIGLSKSGLNDVSSAQRQNVVAALERFEREMATFPGEYARPAGAVVVAHKDGELAGCVCVRKASSDTCEVKRLYIRPCLRGNGLGRKLMEAAIREARTSGYMKIRLDTMPSMTVAQELYRSMGFYSIPAYGDNINSGFQYFEKDISCDDNGRGPL